ncbi:MAG: RNA polymerase sigma factor [Planctomycetes bacterium]|nr:RNA polymerase sigma factor [Planctomycetota bacterium]
MTEADRRDAEASPHAAGRRSGAWTPARFEALYEAHVAAMHRYCYFRCGLDRAAAGELTGEIFLALWQGPCPPKQEEAPFLYGIARRKLADFHRARGRAREVRFSDLDSNERERFEALLRDDEPSGSEAPLSECLKQVLGEVLTSLDANTQTLLLDKYVRRRSVKDLAAVHGKSEAAVMSALARARRALREALLACMEQADGAKDGER